MTSPKIRCLVDSPGRGRGAACQSLSSISMEDDRVSSATRSLGCELEPGRIRLKEASPKLLQRARASRSWAAHLAAYWELAHDLG
jgi:hypothetical protein